MHISNTNEIILLLPGKLYIIVNIPNEKADDNTLLITDSRHPVFNILDNNIVPNVITNTIVDQNIKLLIIVI